jgi:hypothetical protein
VPKLPVGYSIVQEEMAEEKVFHDLKVYESVHQALMDSSVKYNERFNQKLAERFSDYD